MTAAARGASRTASTDLHDLGARSSSGIRRSPRPPARARPSEPGGNGARVEFWRAAADDAEDALVHLDEHAARGSR